MPYRSGLISVTGILVCCFQMMGNTNNVNEHVANARVTGDCVTESPQRAAAQGIELSGVLPVGSVIASVFPWEVLQARSADVAHFWRPADGRPAPVQSKFAALCKRMAMPREGSTLLGGSERTFVAYVPDLQDAYLPRLQKWDNEHQPKVQLCNEETQTSVPLLEPLRRPQRDAEQRVVAPREIYFYIKIN
jgi:hypothetical protein